MAAETVVTDTADSTDYQQLFTAVMLQEITEHQHMQQVCTALQFAG
jgi:hypothetical protein